MKFYHHYEISLMLAVLLFLCLSSCQKSSVNEERLPYLNMEIGTAYVGSDACRDCHEDIFESYMQTGMGRSLYKLNAGNLPEDFIRNNSYYDPKSNFLYTMVHDKGEFYQVESLPQDSSHFVRRKIAYVVGSGNNVRSYLSEVNGFLFEMPISWYAGKKIWDLSPGYHVYNQRFSRVIVEECMNCHNSFAPVIPGSMNRYSMPIPEGIGCERCHGPGKIHVRARTDDLEKKMGHNDSTIVNPERLGRQESLDVCQQCHIPGAMRVTRNGKREQDFRPGMKLSEIKSIYLDAATDEAAFRITSHPERLVLSKCFVKSEMTCVTCHNPHVSVYEAPMSLFNGACLECHTPSGSLFSGNFSHQHKKTDNCVACHMKQGGTVDIPHVEFTDHWIRREIPKANKLYSAMVATKSEADSHTINLKIWTDSPDSESKIRHGIAYYKYYFNKHSLPLYLELAMSNLNNGLLENPNSIQGIYYRGLCFIEAGQLDSAERALNRVRALDSAYTDLFYWLGQVAAKQNLRFQAIEFFKRDTARLKNDPNTLFYIAIAYDQLGEKLKAMDYYERTLDLNPNYLEACLNLGLLNYTFVKEYEEAERLYTKASRIEPGSYDVYFNLGNVYAKKSEWARARINYEKAIALKPDGFECIANLVQANLHVGDRAAAKKYARRALSIKEDQRMRDVLEGQ